MEDAQIQSETTEEWVYTFHGISYIVCITVSSRVLTIQLEDAENGDRWSADFTAQYIEELTLKAGNYKKFGVFTTMLMSAFSKNSESVYVDLLTHSDIVVLKAKKSGIDTSQVTQNDAIRRSSQHKRYLVLTYTGEFDRVHFPLPLSFEETPNAIALQKSIRRLRAKLKEKRETDLEPSSEREK
jgi:coiled-coil domain-containing protein 61